MYLRDLKASLIRRWYLVVAGLLLTGALGFAAFRLVPPTYEASASDVLLPPQSSVIEGGNPFLYLGGLTQALDVLTRSLQSDATQRTIAVVHPTVTYVATPDRTTTGPILLITTEAPTSAEAMAGLKTVLDQVEPKLRSLQDDLNVPPQSRITVMNLAIDDEPTAVTRGQTRAVLAAVGFGLIATILLTGLIDGLMQSRRTRHASPTGDEPDSTSLGPDSQPSARGRQGPPLAPRRRSGGPALERMGRGATTDQRTP